MRILTGTCHCGNLNVSFETELDPAGMVPRACQCSFCRRHSTAAVSDPAGTLTFRAADPAQLNRYTFGLRSTEFLICRTCGVYVGAFMPDGDGAFANVMAGVLDARDEITQPPVPVHRSQENFEERQARRRIQWTPALLIQESR
mgnify:CR=1 FL=1